MGLLAGIVSLARQDKESPLALSQFTIRSIDILFQNIQTFFCSKVVLKGCYKVLQ